MKFYKHKRFWWISLPSAVLVVAFLSGPVPPDPKYNYRLPHLPSNLEELEAHIQNREASLPLRKDAHARILWHEGRKQKTEISIVYLHGFSGTYRDGYPLNVNLAEALNANIYLSRWAGHGMKPNHALENFTPENAWESAQEALAIGERIGEKVVILSTSTGGTLALHLAAHYPNKVAGLVNISPNIKDDQFGAFLLNTPWGGEIAHLVSFGQHRKIKHESDLARHYWDTIYPAEALVNLQVLVNSTMTDSTFMKIHCPVLTLYYHENFLKEDEHVEVSIYEKKHQLLGSPEQEVKLIPLEKPKSHFIGSDIKSKDYQTAQNIALEFIREHIR
jgi:esterase/lipase